MQSFIRKKFTSTHLAADIWEKSADLSLLATACATSDSMGCVEPWQTVSTHVKHKASIKQIFAAYVTWNTAQQHFASKNLPRWCSRNLCRAFCRSSGRGARQAASSESSRWNHQSSTLSPSDRTGSVTPCLHNYILRVATLSKWKFRPRYVILEFF